MTIAEIYAKVGVVDTCKSIVVIDVGARHQRVGEQGAAERGTYFEVLTTVLQMGAEYLLAEGVFVR